MSNPIYHITPFTQLDYPDKLACIIWFAGCNMRCLYCYNTEIVKGKGRLSYEEALEFLKSRKNLLDAVVLSGGECTMHIRLEEFIHKIKDMHFLVKIDTNGSHPRLLSKLIRENLIDYVALDFKALQDRFFKITRSDHFKDFEKTLELLVSSKIPFEVRTTVHSEFLDQDYLIRMARYLKNKSYSGTYFLQSFFNDIPTLGSLKNDYKSIPAEFIQNAGLQIEVRKF
ncbi:MAG: anaerobic ribonucleoside-triphosphate reductase activating protein [Saprospiraceae bacterium]|nr:anaerobic ribonucleoside-triphosphate reductase activating protein [Saprospiraceae bacterium]